ncbi:hypothetical protein [Tritonibacter mobilis]|uniref:hypothetical protein n=1 Tax=Tritonibacter mobilis TaxID=379347 RepID=UPI00398FC26F
MACSRFFLMVVVSTVLVFGLMYLNTYLFGHIFWSETRTFMGAVMASSRAEITDANDTALVKISGDLIRFDREGASFTAVPITIQVRDTENDSVQDLVISAVSDYEAGFRGQYNSTN